MSEVQRLLKARNDAFQAVEDYVFANYPLTSDDQLDEFWRLDREANSAALAFGEFCAGRRR